MPLPGTKSHYKMAPMHRVSGLEDTHIQHPKAKEAAVMALFYPNEAQQAHLLLMLRKSYDGVHSNQISLPGGKREKADQDLLTTALRETREEVGAIVEEIQTVATLTPIYIPPSNFWVQPFMGTYQKTQPFVPQQTEVELLVEVSVEDFLDNGLVAQKNVSISKGGRAEVPAFEFGGYVVWGATAMILSEIKDLIKPWV